LPRSLRFGPLSEGPFGRDDREWGLRSSGAAVGENKKTERLHPRFLCVKWDTECLRVHAWRSGSLL